MTTSSRIFQPEKIIAALNAHHVDYVVIGMFAAGVTNPNLPPTTDIDVTPSALHGNLERLSTALRSIDARIRVEGIDDGLAFSHSGASLAAARFWNLTCEHGEFDLSFTPSGTDGYPDLITHAERRVIGAELAPIADLADIIRSKEAADRPKDHRVLPLLQDALTQNEQHPATYVLLRSLANHLNANPTKYRDSALLANIREGTLTALRPIDVTEVLGQHNIDPNAAFTLEEADALRHIAKARGIQLPTG
jgi:hypothetical protein